MEHIFEMNMSIDKKNNAQIPCVQYDYGTRKVQIRLMQDEYPLDITGCTVVLSAMKPDYSQVFNDCKIVDSVNGVVEFTVTEQISVVSGLLNCEIKIYDGSGVLTTKQFNINVTKSSTGKNVLSSNEFTALTNAINEVKNIDSKFAEVNTQLENKANLNSVFSMANMGQDVKEAMTGGSVAVVGVNSVLEENIVDKQVTYEKLSFVDVTRYNLCNNNFTEGYYINGDGYLFASASYKVSDFIKVEPGKVYSTNSTLYFARYDSSKKIVKGFAGSFKSPWTCEDGVCYIKVSYGSTVNAMFNKGDALLDYVNYDDIGLTLDKNLIDEMTKEVENTISVNGDAIKDSSIPPEKNDYVVAITNLFNINAIVDGLVDSTGIVKPYDDAKTTDFIPVEEGESYKIFNNNQMFHSAYYDENKNIVQFISGGYYPPITVPTGKKIKYIRVGFSARLATNKSMIYKINPSITDVPFVEFGKKAYSFSNVEFMESMKSYLGSLENKFRTNLPNQIELVEGDAFELFYDSIIDVVKYSNYNVAFEGGSYGTKVYAYNRKISYELPSSSNTKDIKLTWTNDNKNVVGEISSSVIVCPKKNPATTKNVLVIGDSLTDRAGTVSTLAEKMKTNGFTNVKFIGTRSSGYTGAYHEGRSGWRISDYLSQPCYNGTDTNSPNPFWFNGECNFIKYCQANSFSGIDYAIIHLNWNDSWRDSYNMVNSKYNGLVQRLKRDYPNCKIVLVSVPFRNIGQFNTIWNSCTKEQIFNLNDEMEKYCENNSNVHWVNTFMQCDSEYNNEVKDIQVNLRNTKTEMVCVDHVHPGILGYKQIADAYYRKLNYLFNLYE